MSDLVEMAQELAQRERDAGIKSSATHADETIPGWTLMAHSFLISYARQHEHFVSEDVSAAAVGVIPPPPERRAWGSVYVRTVKAGIIVQDGYGRSKQRCSICPRWKSRIYDGRVS